MTHVGVTGGAKVIFQHADELQKLGVHVTIVSHFPRPTWYPVTCDYVQVPFQVELAQGIPLCDVIVATYWDHIQACVETGIAPVVYFEQGDFHLFEDLNPELFRVVQCEIQSAAFVTTVSRAAANALKSRFGRDAQVFPNALDRDVFFPNDEATIQDRKPYLMMIGSDKMAFKGTADVLAAYHLVREAGYDLDLVWVTPQPLSRAVGSVYVQPEQRVLADLYRGAAAFVSGSHYEAFSLPPLEAMACGCPVITTANAGAKEYAVDGENCLLVDVGDPHLMARQIIRVLTEPGLAARLRKGGLQTACRFDWNVIAPELHEFYQHVASFQPAPIGRLADWEIYPKPEMFLNHEGYMILEHILQQTHADVVKAPSIYELLERHLVARWEIVARRVTAGSGEELFVYVPVKGTRPELPYAAAYDSFASRNYASALASFVRFFQQSTDMTDKVMYIRWILLCLIELRREDQALQVARDAVQIFPENSDLIYLHAVIRRLAGLQQDFEEDLKTILMLGEAAEAPEFFYGIGQLAVEHCL